MLRRRLPPLRIIASPTLRGKFDQCFDELEARRNDLMARLVRLGKYGRRNLGYKNALNLLNDKFRKSKLPQRMAVLQAAAWLIDILERSP